MSKTKVLSKLVIVAIIISLAIGLLLCTVNTQPARAEANNELMTTQTVDDEGNITYSVSNVKNYLEPAIAMRSSRAIEDKVEGLLKALQYSDEQIADMSHEQKMEFQNTEDAIVTSKQVTYNETTEDIESKPTPMNKLTIWSRVVRTGDNFVTGDGTRHIYRLLGTVVYDKFTSNGWIPQMREKDAMVFAWTNNVIILDGNRSGKMTCDTVDFFSHKFKSRGTSYMGQNKFVTEYAPTGGWGIRFDLPNNSLINGYCNFILEGECRVAALEDFGFYMEYGHKTIAGTLNASINGVGTASVGISFQGKVDVSKAPPIGVFTPPKK